MGDSEVAHHAFPVSLKTTSLAFVSDLHGSETLEKHVSIFGKSLSNKNNNSIYLVFLEMLPQIRIGDSWKLICCQTKQFKR
jgi:hypothetical protein